MCQALSQVLEILQYIQTLTLMVIVFPWATFPSHKVNEVFQLKLCSLGRLPFTAGLQCHP